MTDEAQVKQVISDGAAKLEKVLEIVVTLDPALSIYVVPIMAAVAAFDLAAQTAERTRKAEVKEAQGLNNLGMGMGP